MLDQVIDVQLHLQIGCSGPIWCRRRSSTVKMFMMFSTTPWNGELYFPGCQIRCLTPTKLNKFKMKVSFQHSCTTWCYWESICSACCRPVVPLEESVEGRWPWREFPAWDLGKGRAGTSLLSFLKRLSAEATYGLRWSPLISAGRRKGWK